MNDRNYYYLIAGLPELVPEQSKIPFSLAEFLEDLKMFLHPNDFQWVRLVLLSIDNQNLIALLKNKTDAWWPNGNFSRSDLESLQHEPELFPEYMHRFYQAYRSEVPLWPNLSWENQLNRLYQAYRTERAGGFLHDYFLFENRLKNVLTAWNHRAHGSPLEGQLVGEGEVLEALQKAHGRDFGLAVQLPWLDKLLHALEKEDLVERERGIDRIKWNFIDEENTFNYFSVEVVLGYLLKLMMLERWLHLDPERGANTIDHLIQSLENSVAVPNP